MEERLQYLFRRYRDNLCTRQEYEEFFALLKQADRDDALRNLISQVYAGEASNATDTFVNGKGKLVARYRNARTRSRNTAISVAAAGLLLAGAAFWLMQHEAPTAALQMARQETARSEYKHVILPDSTEVWLNAASTLDYPESFGKTNREVYLSGEAYFDVRKAAQQPFIIHTGKVSTTVLGTAFNINAYPERRNVVVSVSNGKVSVNYGNNTVTTLTRGQQLKVEVEDKISADKKSGVTEAAPWKAGNLSYDGETLGNILADLERVYDVKIRVMQEDLKSLTVSTGFKKEIGAEEALQVLCKLTDTRLSLAEGVYTIH